MGSRKPTWRGRAKVIKMTSWDSVRGGWLFPKEHPFLISLLFSVSRVLPGFSRVLPGYVEFSCVLLVLLGSPGFFFSDPFVVLLFFLFYSSGKMYCSWEDFNGFLMDFNGVLTDFFNGLDSPLNRSDLYWDLFFFFFFRTEQKKKEKKKKKVQNL